MFSAILTNLAETFDYATIIYPTVFKRLKA